ncbi:MAG: hypothetical protein ABSE73_22440 [Planctomycetota bacterium]
MKHTVLRAAVLALWYCALVAWAEAARAGEGGAALENKALLVTAAPGQPGVTVCYKSEAANPRVVLALLAGGADQSAPISTAEATKDEAGKSVLRVSAGAAQAEFSLGAGIFVKIVPGKNAAGVEVRTTARYAVLPDFFSDDVVFDPVHLPMPKTTVPAENFLLEFLEGGDTIVMCVWPGNLKFPGSQNAAAPEPKAEKEGPEPQVDLVFAGAGQGRRISAARIEFQNKPVYAGILEQKGLWHDEEVSAWPAYKPTSLAWKRPFEARWRGDFMVGEGKSMSDWPTRTQSFEFRNTSIPKTEKWWEGGEALDARFMAATSSARPDKWWEKGINWWQVGNEDAPEIWQESLVSFFRYPAFFKGDEVRVCLYADKGERGKANDATKAARKANKDAPEIAPPNVYEHVLIYPLGRVPSTPLNVYTPVDLMRQTLGAGPCEYVLDLAGVKPRQAGGDRPLLAFATCGLWGDHIKPLTKKFKKKPDGAYEPLEEQDKTHLVQALEDMWYFVHTIHDRLRDYKKWGADAAAYCEQEAAKNPQVKPVADKALACLARLNSDVGRHKFEGPGSEAYWKDRIPALIKLVQEDKYAEVGEIEKITHLGNDQDERVSRCRQYVKGLRQEILLQDTSSPDVRRFAAEIRDRCHAMLRNMLPKEGF